LLNSIVFLRPITFEEQKKTFEKLKEVINNKVGLIIFDSVAMLYRLELGKTDDVYEVNKDLGKQLAYLKQIASKKNIPVLITNQVYADFEDKDKINIVGGDLLKYSSKCLLELQITPSGNRRCIVKKHRAIEAEKSITFKIVEGGILGTKEGKGFRLF
jgi:DNA repair protein RadB